MRDLQAKCIARAEECYAIANAHFNREFKRIPIMFSNKLTKTGGYFQYSRNWIKQEQGNGAIKIQLSNSILSLNPEQFIKEVPGHEIAHHIVHELYGANEQSHGTKWKQVMALFGQTANRTHSMKTEQSNKFTYNVNGTEVQVGKIRHNKIQTGRANYSLRGAGTILASHWVDSALAKVNKPQRPTMPQRKATGSKADIVRAQIAIFKSMYSLEQCLSGHLLYTIATAANMKEGLCKTYIKNNWSKV